MKEAAAEITLAMLSAALFSAGQIAVGGSVYLYLFLLAGTTAGAILVIAGGKNYAMFDTGANGIVAKFISHIAVTIGFGALAVDWAVKALPDHPPEAVALATGMSLALLGTPLLLKIAPLIVMSFSFLKWKFPNAPLANQTQTADSATTVTQTPSPNGLAPPARDAQPEPSHPRI